MTALRSITALCAAGFLAAACQPEANEPQPPAPPPPADETVAPPPVDAAPVMPGATGGVCGGFVDVACANPADYCHIDMTMVGVADATGVCTIRPEICTMDYRPVCGTDGVTYGNACAAASEGVNVVSEGECPEIDADPD